MKNNILLRILLLFTAGVMAAACTQEREAVIHPEVPTDIRIDTRAIPGNHTCNLYIFKNSVLSQIVGLPSGTVTIVMNQAELIAANSFRFLYVSQPTAASNGVTVKKSGGSALAVGDTWTNVRIEAMAQDISSDVYYKIENYTGAQLAGKTTIISSLTRLVGQQVIDIFKVKDGNINTPDGTTADVKSVLDRVNKIELTYTGLVKEIGFNTDGTITETASWPSPLVKTLNLTVVETAGTDLLKVELPQSGVNAGTPGGSARIMGVWGLQATKKIRIAAKFSYYHTTPLSCSGTPSTHSHTKSCFPHKGDASGTNKALFLNLPAQSSQPINIQPNVYTINKVGIRYDRVIDVGVNGGFGFITDWANGNVGP